MFVAPRLDSRVCCERCRYQARKAEGKITYSKHSREANAQKNHRRRVRKAETDLRPADLRVLLESRRFCPLCRRRMTDEAGPWQKNIDHIVPLAAGGTHTIGNVRVICRTCNLSRPTDGSDVSQESLWARAR